MKRPLRPIVVQLCSEANLGPNLLITAEQVRRTWEDSPALLWLFSSKLFSKGLGLESKARNFWEVAALHKVNNSGLAREFEASISRLDVLKEQSCVRSGTYSRDCEIAFQGLSDGYALTSHTSKFPSELRAHIYKP